MRKLTFFALGFVALICIITKTSAFLYPLDSETRNSKRLDGLWWFVLEPPNSIGWGLANQWWSIKISSFQNSTKIPVPASYNDLSSSKAFRDHVGWAWYQTSFFVDQSWISGCSDKTRIVLRFGSVNYFAAVWLNEINIMNHTGGHLPFETEICSILEQSGLNWITVAVNNTLSHSTVPQAEFEYKNSDDYPKDYFVQTVGFDFFNYAGILRPVILYTTPKIFVDDINLTTLIKGYDGHVSYSVLVEGQKKSYRILTSVLDNKRKVQGANSNGANGNFVVHNANFWWPIGENASIKVFDHKEKLLDVYRLEFAIRTVEVRKNGFFINGKRFYFKGCGMHEDFHIIGRGYNEAVMIKDLNLLQWLGANSYRTSHYPYAEERLFESDRRGLVVVHETPAVGLRVYTDKVLQLHRSIIKDMINRDKNHPSVVMWSVANEPWGTYTKQARNYFKTLVSEAKGMDRSRPITIVYGTYETDKDATADFFDVISINRYYGWYLDNGHTELIVRQLTANIMHWYTAYHKPILITEYGADTLSGFHQLPVSTFAEDYQIEFMSQYHLAFDSFRNKSVLVGEMFWNFADFVTDQGITRVLGNRKGVFTRERQPKMAAYLMKYRYENLNKNMIIPTPANFL